MKRKIAPREAPLELGVKKNIEFNLDEEFLTHFSPSYQGNNNEDYYNLSYKSTHIVRLARIAEFTLINVKEPVKLHEDEILPLLQELNIDFYPPLALRRPAQNLYSIGALCRWERETLEMFFEDEKIIIPYRDPAQVNNTYYRTLDGVKQFIKYEKAWLYPYDINYFCYNLINYVDEMCRSVIL